MATAALLIPAFLGALFLLPRAGFAAVALLVAAAGAVEWARLCALGRAAGLVLASVVLMVAYVGVAHEAARMPLYALGAAFWLLAVPAWLSRGMRSQPRWLLVGAGALVLVPAAVALAVLPPGTVLAVLALTWIADTAAYFTGRKFGRRKLAPSISPGKTWEGAGGAVAGVLAYAIILALSLPELRGVQGAQWGAYLAGALLLCAISIVGDLFESAAKRQAGVKDSGTLLPGHGGILDRIDSATSTLPLAALLLPWFAPA